MLPGETVSAALLRRLEPTARYVADPDKPEGVGDRFADAILRLVLADMDDVRIGSLYAALAIMFLPVMLLGVYSPFAIRLVLRTSERSGTVSCTVYGGSTAGSIAGTLGTTFSSFHRSGHMP